MELAVSVTVTMTGEDGTAVPVNGELAAALAAPAEQFASMLKMGGAGRGLGGSRGPGGGDRNVGAGAAAAAAGSHVHSSMPAARNASSRSPVPRVSGTAPWRKAMTGA